MPESSHHLWNCPIVIWCIKRLLYTRLIVVWKAVELLGLQVEKDPVALADAVRVGVGVVAASLEKVQLNANFSTEATAAKFWRGTGWLSQADVRSLLSFGRAYRNAGPLLGLCNDNLKSKDPTEEHNSIIVVWPMVDMDKRQRCLCMTLHELTAPVWPYTVMSLILTH